MHGRVTIWMRHMMWWCLPPQISPGLQGKKEPYNSLHRSFICMLIGIAWEEVTLKQIPHSCRDVLKMIWCLAISVKRRSMSVQLETSISDGRWEGSESRWDQIWQMPKSALWPILNSSFQFCRTPDGLQWGRQLDSEFNKFLSAVIILSALDCFSLFCIHDQGQHNYQNGMLRTWDEQLWEEFGMKGNADLIAPSHAAFPAQPH